MQTEIRTDTAPPGPPLPAHKDARALLRADDDSLQIHACHGRARQVEVIRDAILHLLERDPTLEPRDVIVMCPDIETVAPLIQATFGAGRALDDGADEARATARTTTGMPSRPPSVGACPTCTSASPTGRCARRTPCSASSRCCSSSPMSG